MKTLATLTLTVLVSVMGAMISLSQTRGQQPKSTTTVHPTTPAVKKAAPAPVAPAPAPTADSKVKTDTLASGHYIVFGGSQQALRIYFPADKMKNVSVAGHFAVTDNSKAGGDKNLDVYLLNEADYVKWIADAKIKDASKMKPIYSSGQVAQGDLKLDVPNPGSYYLVFSNRFDDAGQKTFDIDVKMHYEVP